MSVPVNCYHMSKKNRNAHYRGNIVIKLIEHFELNFSRGSIIKYVARAGSKDDELLDLLKARDYLDREIARVKKRRKNDNGT